MGQLKREELKEKSEEEMMQEELESDADALSQIIHSKHTPAHLRSRLLETLDEIRVTGDSPEVLRVDYPLSVMYHKQREKGSEQ